MLLQVEGVAKYFSKVAALEDVSFSVTAGEITGLIGPNGSGKTTLFALISGFLAPTRGRILFEGRDLARRSPDKIARQGLVRTFQHSPIPARMTVIENMLLAAPRQEGESLLYSLIRFGRVRAAERAHLTRARELLALVKLDHMGDELAGSLSGGQRKLLALAQALMAEGKLILLDEPMAGVNPRLIDELLRAIREVRSAGYEFLVVEHNMTVVRALCDTIHVLDAGRIIASGPPQETLQREEVLEAYLSPKARSRQGPAPPGAPNRPNDRPGDGPSGGDELVASRS